MAKACEEAGPLDRKTLDLIKVGICVGAGLETVIQRLAFSTKQIER